MIQFIVNHPGDILATIWLLILVAVGIKNVLIIIADSRKAKELTYVPYVK